MQKQTDGCNLAYDQKAKEKVSKKKNLFFSLTISSPPLFRANSYSIHSVFHNLQIQLQFINN